MQGIFIGLAAFLIIGLFHPIIIKVEFYFTKRAFPVFIVLGIACVVLSIVTKNFTLSAILGVLGFTCFWSVKELFEQEKRVQKGWFPKNERRM